VACHPYGGVGECGSFGNAPLYKQWVLVARVAEDTALVGYIGDQRFTVASGLTDPDNGTFNRIGDNGAGLWWWNGQIALIAVYSRALSAAEIQRSYRSIARLYWDYRSICVSGWESHCQSPPLHAKLLAPWQPDGTWALAMLPRKLGLVPVWREAQ